METRPDRGSVVAMIPARMGSMRLPNKNLALLNGQPLIAYAIEAAKHAGVFDRIVVNSEDEVFQQIAMSFSNRNINLVLSDEHKPLLLIGTRSPHK